MRSKIHKRNHVSEKQIQLALTDELKQYKLFYICVNQNSVNLL
jgi:hypothetical protein